MNIFARVTFYLSAIIVLCTGFVQQSGNVSFDDFDTVTSQVLDYNDWMDAQPIQAEFENRAMTVDCNDWNNRNFYWCQRQQQNWLQQVTDPDGCDRSDWNNDQKSRCKKCGHYRDGNDRNDTPVEEVACGYVRIYANANMGTLLPRGYADHLNTGDSVHVKCWTSGSGYRWYVLESASRNAMVRNAYVKAGSFYNNWPGAKINRNVPECE